MFFNDAPRLEERARSERIATDRCRELNDEVFRVRRDLAAAEEAAATLRSEGALRSTGKALRLEDALRAKEQQLERLGTERAAASRLPVLCDRLRVCVVVVVVVRLLLLLLLLL